MRRSISGLCLALAFAAVSLAQSAWWLSHTLFDTAAFSDAVHAVAAQPDVRAALGGDIAGELAGGHDLSPTQGANLRSAVDASVSSPAFADELATTLAGVHAALLAGRDPATALDLGSVQDDVRRSLASTDPRAAAAIPQRGVQRNVDPGRRSWVPRVVDAVATSAPALAAAALVLLALAVLVARDRPRTLRRAGYVLVASAAFTLVIRFVVPAVLVPLLPAGVVRTLGAAMVTFLLRALSPALVITAGAGAVLVAIGIAWARSHTRPARAPAQALPAVAPAVAPVPVAVTGPPIANVEVVSPSTPIPAAMPHPAAVSRPAAPDATTLVQPTGGDAAETVEDAGGWGPLRY